MLMSIKGFYCAGVRGSKAYVAAANVNWRLHAPEVVFLLQIVLRSRNRIQADDAEIRRRAHRKRLAWQLFCAGCDSGSLFRFHPSRRNAMALAVSFANQFEQVMIVHSLNLIGQNHKATIDFVEFAPLKTITELLTTKTERMPPRVLAEHQFRIRDAHRLRSHDFVGEAILQHSILMDAGLVRESVAPDDGLIRLHRNTSDFLEQLTRRIKFLTGDAGLIRIAIGTHS